MGAVTALMYGSMDPTISVLVLDSPFYSLKLLIEELTKKRVKLADFVIQYAIGIVSDSVKERAKFDIKNLETSYYATRCFMPAMFCVAKDDDFVDPHHTKDLYKLYQGERCFVEVEGDHNSLRPKTLKDNAAAFLYTTLQVENIKILSDQFSEVQMQKFEEKEKKKLKEKQQVEIQKSEEKKKLEEKPKKEVNILQKPNQNVKNESKLVKENKIESQVVSKEEFNLGQMKQKEIIVAKNFGYNNINNNDSGISNNNNNINHLNVVRQNSNIISNIYGIQEGMSEDEVILKILEYSKKEAEEFEKNRNK